MSHAFPLPPHEESMSFIGRLQESSPTIISEGLGYIMIAGIAGKTVAEAAKNVMGEGIQGLRNLGGRAVSALLERVDH